MQTKDIPDLPILRHLDVPSGGGTLFTLYRGTAMPCVEDAMPPGTPKKLIQSKMKSLIRRGLADGCACGCRGDFELTSKGRDIVEQRLLR